MSFYARFSLLIVLAFLVAEIVLGTTARTLQSDDLYYIDASLTMASEGDWLTPRYATGRARYKKPAMAYWPLANIVLKADYSHVNNQDSEDEDLYNLGIGYAF